MSFKWLQWIALLALLAGILPLIALNFMGGDFNVDHRAGEAEQNMHEIQLALSRYAVDNPSGEYPATLALLMNQHYLPELPSNPYSSGGEKRPMPEVPLGQHVPGGITYVSLYGQLGEGAKGRFGYMLIVYGDDDARRKDMTIRKQTSHPWLTEEQVAAVHWEYALMETTHPEGFSPPHFDSLPEPVMAGSGAE